MKNVKTLIVVTLMGAALFASTTRTDALGGAGFWAEDYANVASFPADVNNHNVAWTDGNNFTSIFDANGTTWGFAGGTDNDVVNMMWGNGTMGVTFGLSMTPEVAAVDAMDASLDYAAASDNYQADTMNCGADGETACGNDTGTAQVGTAGTDEVALVAAATDFSIGFGMPLAGMDFGFTYDGDVGINLRRAQNIWLWDTMLINFDMDMEDLDAGKAAGMGFGASLYSNTSYDSGTNGLFALGFGFNDAGVAPYENDTGVMTSAAVTGVDDSMNCDDGNGNLTAPCADAIAERLDPAATIGINWSFAVESAMTNWATARVGYSHGYNFAGDTTGGAGGGFTIGLGFNYGSFTLDMALENGNMFNDPVKYMAGRNDTALGAGWTISYAW